MKGDLVRADEGDTDEERNRVGWTKREIEGGDVGFKGKGQKMPGGNAASSAKPAWSRRRRRQVLKRTQGEAENRGDGEAGRRCAVAVGSSSTKDGRRSGFPV